VGITVLLVAGGIFGVLTVTVVLDGAGGVASIDASVLHSVIAARAGWLTELAKVFTAFGTGPVVYGLLILVGLAVWRRTGTWVPAAVAVGALAVGQAVRLGISDAVARARPPEQVWLVHPGGYAYPSGHTTTAVIGYGLLAGLAAGLVRQWSVGLFAAAGLLAVAVAGSRVYLGVHWLSDVVGGWMFGVAWLALVYTGASARITLPRAGSDRDRKAGGRRPRPEDGRPSAREARAVTRP
jgi:undecaprenyl-diphosphatase